MIFVVEAWFRNAVPETVLELLCAGLTTAGFTGVSKLTIKITSWECLTLGQHKIFVGIGPRSEDHLAVTVKIRSGGDEAFSAFEYLFIYLLNHCQNVRLAELLISIRNSQPYPFLTHSFHRRSFPPTIIDLDEDKVFKSGEDNYWRKWGPELHFIANDVFERTQVNVATFARSLTAEIIYLEGGVLLDCGWTKELALPQQYSYTNCK